MEGEGGIVPGEERAPTVCLAVHAHVVPDGAMAHSVLLGRDVWADFPKRKYVDINENETVLTVTSREEGKCRKNLNVSQIGSTMLSG